MYTPKRLSTKKIALLCLLVTSIFAIRQIPLPHALTAEYEFGDDCAKTLKSPPKITIDFNQILEEENLDDFSQLQAKTLLIAIIPLGIIHEEPLYYKSVRSGAIFQNDPALGFQNWDWLVNYDNTLEVYIMSDGPMIVGGSTKLSMAFSLMTFSYNMFQMYTEQQIEVVDTTKIDMTIFAGPTYTSYNACFDLQLLFECPIYNYPLKIELTRQDIVFGNKSISFLENTEIPSEFPIIGPETQLEDFSTFEVADLPQEGPLTLTLSMQTPGEMIKPQVIKGVNRWQQEMILISNFLPELGVNASNEYRLRVCGMHGINWKSVFDWNLLVEGVEPFYHKLEYSNPVVMPPKIKLEWDKMHIKNQNLVDPWEFEVQGLKLKTVGNYSSEEDFKFVINLGPKMATQTVNVDLQFQRLDTGSWVDDSWTGEVRLSDEGSSVINFPSGTWYRSTFHLSISGAEFPEVGDFEFKFHFMEHDLVISDEDPMTFNVVDLKHDFSDESGFSMYADLQTADIVNADNNFMKFYLMVDPSRNTMDWSNFQVHIPNTYNLNFNRWKHLHYQGKQVAFEFENITFEYENFADETEWFVLKNLNLVRPADIEKKVQRVFFSFKVPNVNSTIKQYEKEHFDNLIVTDSQRKEQFRFSLDLPVPDFPQIRRPTFNYSKLDSNKLAVAFKMTLPEDQPFYLIPLGMELRVDTPVYGKRGLGLQVEYIPDESSMADFVSQTDFDSPNWHFGYFPYFLTHIGSGNIITTYTTASHYNHNPRTMLFRLSRFDDGSFPSYLNIRLNFSTGDMRSRDHTRFSEDENFETMGDLVLKLPGCLDHCQRCFELETPPRCEGCFDPYMMYEGRCITREEYQEIQDSQKEEETQTILEDLLANENVSEEEQLEQILKLLPEEERAEEIKLVEEISEMKEELVVIQERIQELAVIKEEAQASVENTEQAAIKTTVVESSSQVVGTAIMKVSYASQLNVAALSAPGVSALQSTMTYTSGLKAYKGEFHALTPHPLKPTFFAERVPNISGLSS